MSDAGVDGGTLRQWRESRWWDVRQMACELRKAARETGQQPAALSGLMRMINAWERDARPPSDRYLLLYMRIFRPHPNGNGAHPPGTDPAVVLERAAQTSGRAEIAALQLAAFREGRMDLVAAFDKLLALQRQVDDLTEELKRGLGEAAP